MPEYTFYLTKGYRTEHIKAKNLYQAYLLTAKKHDQKAREMAGEIIPTHYQVANDKAYLMSGWKWSNDKRLKMIYKVMQRLEEIRESILAENASYGEIAELQGLAKYIKPDDVLLLQWAGVPEGTK